MRWAGKICDGVFLIMENVRALTEHDSSTSPYADDEGKYYLRIRNSISVIPFYGLNINTRMAAFIAFWFLFKSFYMYTRYSYILALNAITIWNAQCKYVSYFLLPIRLSTAFLPFFFSSLWIHCRMFCTDFYIFYIRHCNKHKMNHLTRNLHCASACI